MTIEFKSFTGKYPNLCTGDLTLLIDGKEVTFGSAGCDYRYFWVTGGSVDCKSDSVSKGPWALSDKYLPTHLKPFGQQLIDVFNNNVKQGCCGGCL